MSYALCLRVLNGSDRVVAGGNVHRGHRSDVHLRVVGDSDPALAAVCLFAAGNQARVEVSVENRGEEDRFRRTRQQGPRPH